MASHDETYWGSRARRAWLTGMAIAAIAALVLPFASCKNLDDPTSPNTPVELTGQNPTAESTFSGTIVLSGGGTAPADGATDFFITATVRDLSGNPVQNGTLLNVSTTRGTIRAAGTNPNSAGSSARVVVFNGKATLAVRSLIAGSATVTAWIANVQATARVNFEPTPLLASASLVFRIGGEDFFGVIGTAPTEIGMVATIRDPNGFALAGVEVRFQIVRDTTRKSGSQKAFLGGPKKSRTDASGEAFNTLNISGDGEVSVVAEVIDPNLGTIATVSNQIIATTTETTSGASVSLSFTDGGTDTTVTPPEEIGMVATVTDRIGNTLNGVPVQFQILEDDTGRAALGRKAPVLTSADGEAFNTVRIRKRGRVVLDAVALDVKTGEPIASSNIVVVRGASGFRIALSLDTGGTSLVGSAPLEAGMTATVTDELGTAVPGMGVRFRIREDSSGTASVVPSGEVFTNSLGQATGTIRLDDPGRVAVEADLFEDGVLFTTSNPVVVSTDALEFISLALVSGTTTQSGSAPLQATVIATVVVSNGSPLPGRPVRFRFRSDTTGSAAVAPTEAFTNAAGQASAVVTLNAIGQAILEADLMGSDGQVVITSNPVILTTTSGFNISLTLASGGGSTSGAVPLNEGLIATVTDGSGSGVAGQRVRFRIFSDSTGTATLATSADVFTDASGQAFNTLSVVDPGTAVVVADLLDSVSGSVVGTSNPVSVTGT